MCSDPTADPGWEPRPVCLVPLPLEAVGGPRARARSDGRDREVCPVRLDLRGRDQQRMGGRGSGGGVPAARSNVRLRHYPEACDLDVLGVKYPRMQMLTVAQIVAGERFQTPSVAARSVVAPAAAGDVIGSVRAASPQLLIPVISLKATHHGSSIGGAVKAHHHAQGWLVSVCQGSSLQPPRTPAGADPRTSSAFAPRARPSRKRRGAVKSRTRSTCFTSCVVNVLMAWAKPRPMASMVRVVTGWSPRPRTRLAPARSTFRCHGQVGRFS